MCGRHQSVTRDVMAGNLIAVKRVLQNCAAMQHNLGRIVLLYQHQLRNQGLPACWIHVLDVGDAALG